jgi:hypothetical protein
MFTFTFIHRICTYHYTRYILMVIYLYLGAIQIQAGYPRDVLRNFLYTGDVKQRLTRTPVYILLVFSTPFLHESRTLLDWACSNTTLTLNEWFTLEDIVKQVRRSLPLQPSTTAATKCHHYPLNTKLYHHQRPSTMRFQLLLHIFLDIISHFVPFCSICCV